MKKYIPPFVILKSAEILFLTAYITWPEVYLGLIKLFPSQPRWGDKAACLVLNSGVSQMEIFLFLYFSALSLPEKSEFFPHLLVWAGGVCLFLFGFVFFSQSWHLSANFQIHHELVKSSLFPTWVHMALEKTVMQLSLSLFLFCVSW